MANAKKTTGKGKVRMPKVNIVKIEDNTRTSKLFDAFTAKDWCALLKHRPEFSGVCRWEKVQPGSCSVIDLLVAQPQFVERINIVDFCDDDGVQRIVDAHPELVYEIPESVKFSCSKFNNYEGIAKVLDRRMIETFARRLDFDWQQPCNFKWLVVQNPDLRTLFDLSELDAMDWGDMIAMNPALASFRHKNMSRPDDEMRARLKEVSSCMKEFDEHHWILSQWREYIPFADFRKEWGANDWLHVLQRCTPEELEDIASIVPWENLDMGEWCIPERWSRQSVFKVWSKWCDHEWLAGEIRAALKCDNGISKLMALLETSPEWVERYFSDVLNGKLTASKDNAESWLNVLKNNPSCAKYIKNFKGFVSRSLTEWDFEELIAAQPSIADISEQDTPSGWSVILRYRPDLAARYESQHKGWNDFMAEHWVNILIGDPALLSKFKGKLIKDSFVYSAYRR